MTTKNERILFIIKHFCDGNKAEFARVMGEKPQTIKSGVTRNAGDNVTKKILSKFQEVNPVWLLTGEGSMLIEDSIVPESNTVDKDDDEKAELIKIIEELRKENSRLVETNERLSRVVDRLLDEKESGRAAI